MILLKTLHDWKIDYGVFSDAVRRHFKVLVSLVEITVTVLRELQIQTVRNIVTYYVVGFKRFWYKNVPSQIIEICPGIDGTCNHSRR